MSILFSVISKAFSYSQQRIVKFFLNSTLRSYLKTPVEADLFDSSSGEAHLENIDLNETSLNAKLASSFLLPVVVQKGSLSQLSIAIPWKNLTENPKIFIRGLQLIVIPRKSSTFSSSSSSSSSSPNEHQNRLSESEREAEEARLKDEQLFEDTRTNIQQQEHPTLSSLETLFSHLLYDIEITVEDITVNVLSEDGHGISLHLNHVSSFPTEQKTRKILFGGVTLSAKTRGIDSKWTPIADFIPSADEKDKETTATTVKTEIQFETQTNSNGAILVSSLIAMLKKSSIVFRLGKLQLEALLTVFMAISSAFLENSTNLQQEQEKLTKQQNELTESLRNVLEIMSNDHNNVSIPKGQPVVNQTTATTVNISKDPLLASSILTSISPYSTFSLPHDPGMTSTILLELGNIKVFLLNEDTEAVNPFAVINCNGIVMKISNPPSKIQLQIYQIGFSLNNDFDFLKFTSDENNKIPSLSIKLSSPKVVSLQSKTSNYELAIGLKPLICILSPSVVSFFKQFFSEISIPLASQQQENPNTSQQQSRLALGASNFRVVIPNLSISMRFPPGGGRFLLSIDPREYLGKESESIIDLEVLEIEVNFRNSIGELDKWTNIGVDFTSVSVFITRDFSARRKVLSISTEERKGGHVLPSMDYSIHQSHEVKKYQPRNISSSSIQTSNSNSNANANSPKPKIIRPPAFVTKTPNFSEVVSNPQCMIYDPSNNTPPSSTAMTTTEQMTQSVFVEKETQMPLLNETFASPTFLFASGGIKSPDKMDWDWDNQFASAKMSLELPVVVLDIHPVEISFLLRIIQLLSTESKDMMSVFINISSAHIKLHDSITTSIQACTSTGRHITLDLNRAKIAVFMNYLRTPDIISSVVLNKFNLKENGYSSQNSSISLVKSSSNIDIDAGSIFPVTIATSKLRVILFDGSQAFINNISISPVIPAFTSFQTIFDPPQLSHLKPKPIPIPIPISRQQSNSKPNTNGKLRAYLKRICSLIKIKSQSFALLLVIDGLEISIDQQKDVALKINGPLFRRLRILYKMKPPFCWNPISIVERSIHPLKENSGGDWSTLISWPPKKQLTSTTSSFPPPIFDVLINVITNSLSSTTVDCKVDFHSKSLRLNISNEILLKINELNGKISELLDPIFGPSQPTQAISSPDLELTSHIIDEYKPNSIPQSNKTTKIQQKQPQVVFLDESEIQQQQQQKQQQTQNVQRVVESDPDIIPPLPQEITEGIKRAKEQNYVDNSDEEEEEEEEEFYDAEDFDVHSISSQIKQITTETTSPTTNSSFTIIGEISEFSIELNILGQNTQQKAFPSLPTHISAAKAHKKQRDHVIFKMEISNLNINSVIPATSTTTTEMMLLKLSLKVSTLIAESFIATSTWRQLLYVDKERLQIWRKRSKTKSSNSFLPDVINFQLSLRGSSSSSYDALDSKYISIRTQCQPFRISMEQSTLSLLLSVFDALLTKQQQPTSNEQLEGGAPKGRKPKEIYVDTLKISNIGLKIDYKPQPEQGIAKVHLGDYIWALRLMPSLSATSLKLVEIKHVPPTSPPIPLSEVVPLISSKWMPGISQVLTMASALKPIHVVFKLANGVASIVKVPVSQYREDGNFLKGLSKGFQTMAVEFLDVGSKATLSIVRLLRWTDESVSGSENNNTISPLADTPETLQNGASAALKKLANGFTSAFEGVAYRPVKTYCHSGGVGFLGSLARNVPGLVIRPVAGAADAIAQILLSARNAVDPSLRNHERALYHHNNTNQSNLTNQAPSTTTTTTTLPHPRLGVSDFEDEAMPQISASSSTASSTAFTPLQSSSTTTTTNSSM